MSWPLLPIAARVHCTGWPAIWLPLILLWPVVIAVFCLALPLVVLVPAPRRSVFATLAATYQVLCALHGTALELDVSKDSTWNISLY